MPKPYSEDLRLRIVKAVESGKTTRAVSAIYQVSPSFVSKVHQLWKQTGGVQGKQIGGYRHALLEPYEAAIREQLAHSPSMTLKELQNWLENEQNISVSMSAIAKFIRHKLGYRTVLVIQLRMKIVAGQTDVGNRPWKQAVGNNLSIAQTKRFCCVSKSRYARANI
jgi:transposase